jgi:hypothetical protein
MRHWALCCVPLRIQLSWRRLAVIVSPAAEVKLDFRLLTVTSLCARRYLRNNGLLSLTLPPPLARVCVP